MKKILNQHPQLRILIPSLNNIKLCYFLWKYKRKNTIEISGSRLKNVKFKISGSGNTVIIGHLARLRNCSIIILGNDNKIEIGGGAAISSVSFFAEDNKNEIKIGQHFTMEGGHIASTEGENITIGDDCMFSGDIEIRNGDSHSIVKNGTAERINWAKSVSIGKHVWLAAHVRVLKGSIIADNSIVGNSSVVLGNLASPNSIYAGNPAKFIKDQVNWDRDRHKFIKK